MDAKTIRELVPSRGPAWEAAIDMGIDVTLLDASLQMTVEERLLALVELNQLADELQAAGRRAQTALNCWARSTPKGSVPWWLAALRPWSTAPHS